MAIEPNVSNEVVMEGMRLKDEVKLASPNEITEADIQSNLELTDSSLSEIERLQSVRIAFAFAFPNLKVPGS